MFNLSDPARGCPDWCQEIGHHTTHHRRMSKITVTGGARPLAIRLALTLHCSHAQAELHEPNRAKDGLRIIHAATTPVSSDQC